MPDITIPLFSTCCLTCLTPAGSDIIILWKTQQELKACERKLKLLECSNFNAIYWYFSKLLLGTVNLLTDFWGLALRIYCPFKVFPLKSIRNLVFHLGLFSLYSHPQLWQLWAVTFWEIRYFNHLSSKFLLPISSSHLLTLTISRSVSSASAWFLRQYTVHPLIKSQESYPHLEADTTNAEILLWDLYFFQDWLWQFLLHRFPKGAWLNF